MHARTHVHTDRKVSHTPSCCVQLTHCRKSTRDSGNGIDGINQDPSKLQQHWVACCLKQVPGALSHFCREHTHTHTTNRLTLHIFIDPFGGGVEVGGAKHLVLLNKSTCDLHQNPFPSSISGCGNESSLCQTDTHLTPEG